MTTRHFVKTGLLAVLLAVSVTHPGHAEERVLLSAGNDAVTEQDLQQALLLLTETEQAQTLAGSDKIKELLRLIYQGKKMAAEAERLGLDQTPLAQARLMATRRKVLSEALRDHSQAQIQPPPDFAALAREHYAARRDEFQLPEQFKAAHILKKVQCDCERQSQRQKIESLLTQLRAGGDFAVLAKAESNDPGSAAQGGDLGQWLKRGDLVVPFADAMAKLEIGQLSDVVETQYGFHLIKLLDRQPARLQSFEEVQPSLEQRLQQSYVQDQLKKRSLDYLPPADAKFDETALQTFLLPGH
jgi:peptidyl-prolyl cis-trans isomerase C